jgi:hypothetical protein
MGGGPDVGEAVTDSQPVAHLGKRARASISAAAGPQAGQKDW